MFHSRCGIYLFIFDDSSDAFKTENSHHVINLTDDVCSPSKPVKTEDRKFVRRVHIMLFPQKRNTAAKGPK